MGFTGQGYLYGSAEIRALFAEVDADVYVLSDDDLCE
jgi:hypothetical protein